MMLTEIENRINKIEDVRDLRTIQGFVKDRKRALPEDVLIQSWSDKGTITKINRTRAVVDMRNGSWNVPFSMITRE